MSLFGRILAEFNKVRLVDKSKLTEYEANRALDELCRINANFSEFDRDVGEQLWEHTTKAPDGKVLLKDYIMTIIDARSILKENIDKCAKQLGFEQDAAQREELEECLQSYTDDYRILGEPFLLEQLPSRHASLSHSQVERSEHKSQLVSQIFTENTTSRQESTSLKVVLVLTLVLIPCEFLCMFARNHFLDILCYFAVISIFALRYFDRTYLKFCEVALAGSVVLDLLWTIVHSSDYWNPSSQTQYSHLQPGLLKFVYILTILMLICRVLVIIILFRFTKNTDNTSKYVRFLNHKIYLSGKVEDNPLSAIILGRGKQ